MKAVGWGVFEAVGHPEVECARGAEFFAEVFGDFDAGLSVTYPEVADGFVGMGEGEATLCHWVGEAGEVKVEA